MRTSGKIWLGAAVLGLVLSTTQAAAAAPPGAAAPAAAGGKANTVTLVTGDRVTVLDGAARSVRPGVGREGMAFSAFSAHGHTYVIPADVHELVATGRLDRRLFDITTLLDFGYEDAKRDTVPLIVTHPAGRAAPRVADAAVTRNLPSINGTALAASKSGAAWEALTDGSGARTAAAGVSKIWLDGKRKSTLDHSVPQIGAPAAYEAGFTGEGIKVAVLDTGVDQTHPDLADREVAEQNFSEAPDNVDNFGHGTHVASIVAGTGAKSDGKYHGVAYGASILDGKVLDDSGFGSDSGIIAGMQWAAEQGADIANLSLGGGDTPELDPLEEAVNSLSEQYGTLFVIAAGNSGPGEGTVASPGSADAALTVGAVDREDAIAPFSSRGPRLGDGAIKPDVTAPGVEIVAALHSAGTINDPVVDGYTALSGTSMATPHVAGAAALIAQQHPDYTGAQLKAVLSGSATPNAELSAFEQGAGRVDVAKALDQTIVSEPTGVSLGTIAWPHDDDEPVTKPLTYRNLGDSDVTLALSVEATGPDGAPAADVFSLSANEITVPAGGTAEVSVTGDAKLGTVDGAYSGAVVATAGESATRTPVAIVREVESYNLKLNYLDDSGAPTGEYSSLIVGMDSDFVAFPYDPDGSVEVRLPKGTYAVDHTVLTGDPLHYNMISQPGLVLDGDQTVDVDARTAKPINVTPPAAAQLAIGDIGYSVATETFEFSSAFVTDDLGVLSTAQLGDPAPGTQLTGKVNTQWQGENGSFYGLTWYPAGEFPTGFEKQVGMDELATVRGQWGPGGEGHGAQRLAFGLPASGGGFIFGANLDVALPGTRTEYYTTDGVVWETSVTEVGADGQAAAQFDAPSRAYRAGRTYSAKFNNAVFGPGLPAREFPWAYRFADEMGVNLPLFTDAYGNAGFSIGDTSSTKLYAGDELVGESPEAGYGFFEDLPAEATDYRLTSDIVRSGWDVSTSISSEWTFSSAHVDGEVEAAVELNTVRFLPSLDENNSAPAGRPFLVPLLMQDETGALQRPKRLTVEVSYDEGKSWQRVPVLLNLVAALHHPDGAESVSLRASAADRDGNTVSQTVVRAYKLRK